MEKKVRLAFFKLFLFPLSLSSETNSAKNKRLKSPLKESKSRVYIQQKLTVFTFLMVEALSYTFFVCSGKGLQ